MGDPTETVKKEPGSPDESRSTGQFQCLVSPSDSLLPVPRISSIRLSPSKYVPSLLILSVILVAQIGLALFLPCVLSCFLLVFSLYSSPLPQKTLWPVVVYFTRLDF